MNTCRIWLTHTFRDALLGIATTLRRGQGFRILTTFVLLYGVSIILFFPADRYRLPLVPVLACFAVAGAQDLITRWHQARRSAYRRVAGLAAAALLVNWPLHFATDSIPFRAELPLYVGVGLQTRGQPVEALALYEQSLAEAPNLADTWYYLGTARRDTGRNDMAIDAFRTCLTICPDHERALHDLALLLAARGEVDAGIALLEQALEHYPAYRRAMINLGVLLIRRGDLETAGEWLRKARVIPADTELEKAAGTRGPVIQVRPRRAATPSPAL